MFGEEIARIRKLGVHGVSLACRATPLSRRGGGVQFRSPQVLFQLLNFLNVVASGLMMWKALCLVTNSESPIVVVLSCVSRRYSAVVCELTTSGSMEPAFYRGDILFLTNPANSPYEIGDITVYKV